jgi:hypothetical protein
LVENTLTILPGVGVAVRLRLLNMLEHDRCGGDHPLFESGELGVSHIAEPFPNRIGRKMQIQRLRWATIAAVQKGRRGGEACQSTSLLTLASEWVYPRGRKTGHRSLSALVKSAKTRGKRGKDPLDHLAVLQHLWSNNA